MVANGRNRTFIETASFAQGARVRLPVLTVRGKRKGRTGVVMAAQHGREINGIAAIERVFNEIDCDKLSGEVIFLPVMNPLGVRMGKHDYPFEETRFRRSVSQEFDINKTWVRKPCNIPTVMKLPQLYGMLI